QELSEGRISGAADAEDEGVDEEADQPLDVSVLAVGDGSPQRDAGSAVLPRVAGEEGREAGREGHEEGRPGLAAPLPELAGRRRGEGEPADAAPPSPHRRPRPV